jgi:AhpD family alkylhydroperoxidase
MISAKQTDGNMPLIPYADIENAPERLQKDFDSLFIKANVFRMWANAPSLFHTGIRMGNSILNKQALPADLRELVILAAARLDGGNYEWAQHVAIGLKAGCTKEQIAALEALRFDDAVFDTRAAAMLKLVREAVQNTKAEKATVTAAMKFFSTQEIVEILLTAGFYTMLARMTETLDVELDAADGTVVNFQKVK